MRACLVLLSLLAGWLSLSSPAAACSCIIPTIDASYEHADHVVHVKIVGRGKATKASVSYEAVLLDDDFKGCLARSQSVTIETAASSAACGVSLAIGDELLLFGQRVGHPEAGAHSKEAPRLLVGLCGGNMPWRQVARDQHAFLRGRMVCCGDACHCGDGTRPVNCFVDPCAVSRCDVEGATCTANYCGGCNAEWSDPDGTPVCAGPLDR